MDYYCKKCRDVSYGNRIRNTRCFLCHGPLERLKGGIPVKRMMSLRELVK